MSEGLPAVSGFRNIVVMSKESLNSSPGKFLISSALAFTSLQLPACAWETYLNAGKQQHFSPCPLHFCNCVLPNETRLLSTGQIMENQLCFETTTYPPKPAFSELKTSWVVIGGIVMSGRPIPAVVPTSRNRLSTVSRSYGHSAIYHPSVPPVGLDLSGNAHIYMACNWRLLPSFETRPLRDTDASARQAVFIVLVAKLLNKGPCRTSNAWKLRRILVIISWSLLFTKRSESFESNAAPDNLPLISTLISLFSTAAKSRSRQRTH